MGAAVPGVFFTYDISPLKVRFTERKGYPFYKFFSWFGAASEAFACNAVDRPFLSLFTWHWLILPMLFVLVVVAYGIAIGLQRKMPDRFGEDRFTSKDASAKAKVSPGTPDGAQGRSQGTLLAQKHTKT